MTSRRMVVVTPCVVSVLVLLVVVGVPVGVQGAIFSDKGTEGTNINEAEAIDFLGRYDREAGQMCNKFMEASWNYNTNVTDFNKRVMLQQQMIWSDFHRTKWNEATNYAWKNFTTPTVRRMFSFLTVLGKAALPRDKLKELTGLLQEMKTTYSLAKICRYDPRLRRLPSGDYDYDAEFEADDDNQIGCIPNLPLEPHLTQMMANSRDPDELRYLWRAWREAAGKPIRQKYLRFVQLSNEAARLNGFSDAGEYWRSDYEIDGFREEVEELWQKLSPLYQQLHAYVRAKLVEKYGEEVVPRRGPIPAHLLGNMWAQTWTNILDMTIPYPGRTSVDVTNALRIQGYSPLAMFRLAEEFFTSLGLEPMPQTFWQQSMIQKPTDREVVCHASAWDFCNGRDYRIKQCTEVNMEHLVTTHHEMGHIQYDLLYRNQPFIFRDGANPGFHEAVGDVLALSASTPRHLQSVGLLGNVDDSYETDINFLFAMALDKIAFLPFGYLMDQKILHPNTSSSSNPNTSSSSNPNTCSSNPNTTSSSNPNTTSSNPNTSSSSNPNTTSSNPNTTSSNPNTTSSSNPNTTSSNPNTTSSNPNTSSSSNPNTTSSNPNTTSSNPNTSSSSNPNTTSSNPNTTSSNPNTSSSNPNTTSSNPNTCSSNPNNY
ncbi:hypothetical protein Pmani_015292 [Petrolisthes manimaculis]|uniref:Angiotensin-converting enzyme n=1 Tax=Petrolisthes manimaculis TaxID=1843537 RepID=A0AAE1U7H7_9EUCA|nr:hypothetical protein Pmani_015292 [Petrolisthes manimaculis]